MHSLIGWDVGLGRQALAVLLAVLAFAIASPAHGQMKSSASTPAERPAARRGPFDENADAAKDIATALVRANVDGKYVLLDFGANWCPDCLALARLLEHKSVQPFFRANFHLVKVDVGRKDKNQDLWGSYGIRLTNRIPAVVVLAPSGQVLAATRGGELADARNSKAAEILDQLKRWRAFKPQP